MSDQPKSCTCTTCPGSTGTCGCQNTKAEAATGCQCDESCACDPACTCQAA